MRNLALLIEYDGTEFKGWQRQPNARTVAGTIESKLFPLVGHEVRLVGAGRTDSGVHATGQRGRGRRLRQLPGIDATLSDVGTQRVECLAQQIGDQAPTPLRGQAPERSRLEHT